MKATSKRILFVIISLMLIIASAVVYSSLILPTYQKVLSLRGQIASQSEVLEKFKITFGRVQKLLSELQNAPNIQKQVSLILPSTKDVSYLASQITGLAEANGLSVSLLSTQLMPIQPTSNSKVINPVGRIEANVKLTGSYGAFKSFLRQIQSNILLLDVSNIKIDKVSLTGEKNSPATLDYTLSIISYYQTSQ